MRRWHLAEIHEQPWCPGPVREGATDCLVAIARWGRQFDAVVPLLQGALCRSGASRILDLCSGSGGPWLNLLHHFEDPSGEAMQIWLTDLYPNVAAMRSAAKLAKGRIHYVATPVDATQVNGELSGFRTLFTAFHHFPPERARMLLQDAVWRAGGIAIFEQTRRTPLAILTMFLLPLVALVVAPFVRPFRLSRLFWTYVVPAIPFVLCVDGVISCLRTYDEEEMAAMIASLEGPRWRWEMGRLPAPLSPIGIGYLIGTPCDERARDESTAVSPRVDIII